MGESAQKFGGFGKLGGFDVGAPATPVNQSVIGSGVNVVGSITVAGSLVVHGTIEGAITAEELVVAQGGIVRGPIKASSVAIAGEVIGEVSASHALSLRAGAKVQGDLETAQLTIEPGATLRGRCSMPDSNGQT